MKKLIAYPITWLLFNLGDLAYQLKLDYFVYHYLMLWSLQVQEWGELESPWSR